MGIGARAACLTILVGSSSLANARTVQIYEGPENAASIAAAPAPRPLPVSDWTDTVGPDEHPIRLSLDGPDSTAFAPRRPIRTTLDPPPPKASVLTPPLPSPQAAVEAPAAPPSPGEAAIEPGTTTLYDADFEARRLRLSLDQAGRGAIGVPSITRPIRLQLEIGEPVPSARRPYRSVLE